MYEISESESDCVDLAKESSEEESDSPSVHFRGDTVFCNQYILSSFTHFQYCRDSSRGRETLLQLPQDLQHKLLTGARQGHFAHLPLLLRGYVLSSSSPAVSSDLLNSILEQHRNAEVTLSCHLDMESSDRDPVVSENGKHKIFFPSFPRMFGYGCFHPKLILIRFPDRLRVCQFSLPQLRSSSHPPI